MQYSLTLFLECQKTSKLYNCMRCHPIFCIKTHLGVTRVRPTTSDNSQLPPSNNGASNVFLYNQQPRIYC